MLTYLFNSYYLFQNFAYKGIKFKDSYKPGLIDILKYNKCCDSDINFRVNEGNS